MCNLNINHYNTKPRFRAWTWLDITTFVLAIRQVQSASFSICTEYLGMLKNPLFFLPEELQNIDSLYTEYGVQKPLVTSVPAFVLNNLLDAVRQSLC